MPAGRPTDFKPEYLDHARKLCLLGATDKQLADFFEVTEQTINNWKKSQPGFFESIKSSKEIADAQVASRLFDKACGYEYQTQQAFKVKKVLYENGKRLSETEEVVTVPVTQVEPPDTTAAIFWLKNRKSDQWRDRREVDHTGEMGIKVIAITPGSEPLRERPLLKPAFDEKLIEGE
jgi:DNA-binding XRE family transcriptional regulator